MNELWKVKYDTSEKIQRADNTFKVKRGYESDN